VGSEKGVARRYAKALVNIQGEGGDYGGLDREFALVVKVLNDHAGVEKVVQDPSLARSEKAKLLSEIVQVLGLSEVMQGLIRLLIEKERFGIFREIAEGYRRFYKDRLGILEVEVRSVGSISEEQVQRVDRLVRRLTGKTAEVRLVQDASILGGLVLRMGNTVLDGSVRNHLERLRRSLVTPQLEFEGDEGGQ